MVETDDRYYTCPKCEWPIHFYYNYDKGVYTSLCPFCKDRLEMDKKEFERNNIEVYFQPDF